MSEAILNILGDCREKFICSSLPARLTEGWRGSQPAPVTAKNTSPIDVYSSRDRPDEGRLVQPQLFFDLPVHYTHRLLQKFHLK